MRPAGMRGRYVVTTNTIGQELFTKPLLFLFYFYLCYFQHWKITYQYEQQRGYGRRSEGPGTTAKKNYNSLKIPTFNLPLSDFSWR
jgi:hypothetical protein